MVKRLRTSPLLKKISGTLIAIPVVNIFGFNDRSRYLPDRRDLNRCFPGLKNGSLASQLAYKFMQEIVLKSDYGIDIHTGAFHRCNYPQIRANINDPATLDLAKSFGAPAIVNSDFRDGSLRAEVSQVNIPMILFESGEALRFDENNIKIGISGILNVMRHIGMLKKTKNANGKTTNLRKKNFVARSSSWLRAPNSGIHISQTSLGKIVKKGDVLGQISNPFGDHKIFVKAHESGMVIGMSMLPLTNKGDALFHIACEKNRKNKIRLDEHLEGENHDHVSHIDSVNMHHHKGHH